MAPLIEQMAELAKRADGCGSNGYRGYDGRCYYYSSWYWWGRWVFAGLAVLFIILVFAFLFRNSRRRRKQGQQPLYGTGWMAPGPPPYYPPPPQYSAQDQNPGQAGGYKYGSGDGYYGGNQGGGYGGNQGGSYSGHQDNYNGNQEGIQLQPPQSTYHREPEYAPPPGPPPNAGK